MCELLCMNYDKTSTDPETDKKCYKRGMIICCRADGWQWSATELSSAYDIIKLPGINPSREAVRTLETKSVPEVEIEYKRRYKIDLDALTVDDRDFLLDEGNTVQARVMLLQTRVIDLEA